MTSHPTSNAVRARAYPTLSALAAFLALFAASPCTAQDTPRSKELKPRVAAAGRELPVKYAGPPTTTAITARDLMTRVYKFADDSMMGRAAGTAWNDIGTSYIAAEFKRLGLKPAGDSGTYFQNPLTRRQIAEGSSLRIGDKVFEVWKDFAVRDQGNGARSFDGAATVYGGVVGDTASYPSQADVAGKVVVMQLPSAMRSSAATFTVPRPVLTQRFATAAAVVVALPEGLQPAQLRNDGVGMRVPEAEAKPVPSWAYLPLADINLLLGANVDSIKPGFAGKTLGGRITYTTATAPGRNVIAILPGSDPSLRGQYVAIGSHNDHIGFSRNPVDHDSVKALMMHAAPQGADSPQPRPTPEQMVAIRTSLDSLRKLHPARIDSIFNGADDDASGSMTLLEIAEALAGQKVKPKRSILFVSHVAEELGLFGSKFFNDNPTIQRDSIVAQLNIDMVGRGAANDVTGEDMKGELLKGGPGYLQLIGSRRLSTELGDMVESVNKSKKLGLRFDYSLDSNGHPQNIYCRSDHYEYARYGTPITFFTTGGHSDYHQVTDEPQYLDYTHMSKIATLIMETAKSVAGLGHRVAVDKAKPDPNGACRQ